MGRSSSAQSYTAEELERETGFDRRTIAYYVQEDLLPRVGRRGPRTRYPKQVRDRLIFIRKIREAEEAGEIPAQSLKAIRRIFENISPETISDIADGRSPLAVQLVEDLQTPYETATPRAQRAMSALSDMIEASCAHDLMDIRDDVRYARVSDFAVASLLELGGVDRIASDYAAIVDTATELSRVLDELQNAARRGKERKTSSVDRWLRIDITSGISLSVRGLSDKDAELLDDARRYLRELIRLRRRSRK